MNHNNCRRYEVKFSKLLIGHTRLTYGHFMTRNDQQLTCTNAACRNQTVTIKRCLEECLQWGTAEKNTITRPFYKIHKKRLRSGKDNKGDRDIRRI